MTYPEGIITRPVEAGSALAVTDGRALTVETVTVASRALIHLNTGTRLEKVTSAKASRLKGESLYWVTACTDRSGEYLDADTREIIILGEDEHTHTYTTTLRVFDEDGDVLGTYEIGPYPVPTPETPFQYLDLDSLQVVDVTTGTAIPIPESWSQIVADAEQAAADAQEAAAAVEPALTDIADLKTKTTTGYLAPAKVAPLDTSSKVPAVNLPMAAIASSAEVTSTIANAIAPKANAADVYSKTQADALYSRPRANTAVLIGDSHFQRGGGLPTNRFYTSTSPFNWANSLLGHAFDLLANLAVGGKRTDEIIDAQLAPALALNPGWVFVVGGTNDPNNSLTAAQTIANLDTIVQAVVNAGAVCVLSTVPPVDSMLTSDKERLSTINNWIKSQGRSRRGLIVVDAWSVLVDPANGNLKTDYSAGGADTVHLSARGAYQWGIVMRDAMKPFIGGGGSFARYEDDPRNLIARSHFLVANSNQIAQGPSTWTVASMLTAGCTFAWEDRTDAAGKWLVITVPAGVGEQVMQKQVMVTSDTMRSGDEVFAVIEYEAAPSEAIASQNFGLTLSTYNGSTTTLVAGDMPFNAEPTPANARKGSFRTPPAAVVAGGPGGSRSMLVGLSIRGAGVYKVAASGLFNQTLYPEMAETA